jgi:hypothetical protein
MALISFWDVKRPRFRRRADSDAPGLLESMVDRARSVAMLAYRETFEQEKSATQRRHGAGTKKATAARKKSGAKIPVARKARAS